MTHALTLLFCIMGFAWLALAMERPQLALFRRLLAPGQTRGFRIAGFCALALALRFIVGEEGWALGLVRYSGCTSVAAGLVYGALIVRERFTAS